MEKCYPFSTQNPHPEMDSLNKSRILVSLALFGVFVCPVVFFFLMIFGLLPYNWPSNFTASKQSVAWILNDSHLGESRMKKVIHSHRSGESFTGDHETGHAIQLTQIDANELLNDPAKKWTRGDQLSGFTKDAVDFSAGFLSNNKMPWFPKYSEIRSSDIFVSVLNYQRNKGRIVFVRPKDQMLFFLDAKF